MKLRFNTLDALTEIINGEIEGTIYKSGPQIIKFFNELYENWTYKDDFGASSRWNFTENTLVSYNDSNKIKGVLEHALDICFFQGSNNFAQSEASENQKKAIAYINSRLLRDGYKLEALEDGSVRALTTENKIVKFGGENQLATVISNDFIASQQSKCQEKISAKDFEGAITNARSLIEAILCEIYKEMTDQDVSSKGDLVKLYKSVKPLLNLSSDKKADDSFNKIFSGFSSIVSGLAEISNTMSDRHNRKYKPSKRHAVLAVNLAFSFTSFLVDSYVYRKNKERNLK